MKILQFTINVIIILSLSKTNVLSQWVQTNGPTAPVLCLAVNNGDLFAGTLGGGGLYSSTDGGINWTLSRNGITCDTVLAITGTGAYVFAGTLGGGVFRSVQGTTWDSTNSGLTDRDVFAMAVNANYLFAAGGGVCRSSNNGLTWQAANNGLTDRDVRALLTSGADIYAGTQGGVFRSSNDGEEWIQADSGLTGLYIRGFAANENKVFAATWSGVFVTSDRGVHWTNTGQIDVQSLWVGGPNILAGRRAPGWIFLSTNNGTSWDLALSGMSGATAVMAFTANDSNIFAATVNAGIWMRARSQIITALDADVPNHPGAYVLDQNYPNPFNPTTDIRFTNPSMTFVSLTVHDLLGREIAAIVREELPAGSYSRKWNATGWSSGIYFYRLSAGSHVETKKLVIVR